MRTLTPFLISVALALACATELQAQASQAPSLRSQLLDSVAGQLVNYFQADGTLVLEPQRPWNPASAASPVEVVVAEYPKELASLMIVRLRIVAGGEVISEPTLALKAQLMRDVYVARNPISRDALFEPSLFELRSVDTLRERDPVLAGKPVPDMVLARSIPSGKVLSWTDLAKRPLVRRGEWVEVAATDGALTIVLRAQALENGSQGDYVRVRNMESRKDFNALVVADNRAEVRF